MTDLTVDSDYLDQLAGKQSLAAAAIGNASSATDDVHQEVWTTHGCYAGAGNRAIDDALAARTAAATAMQNLSTYLVEQLSDAADLYEGADQQAGANLDEQLLL